MMKNQQQNYIGFNGIDFTIPSLLIQQPVEIVNLTLKLYSVNPNKMSIYHKNFLLF